MENPEREENVDSDVDVREIMPSMNVSANSIEKKSDESVLISDETLMGVYGEIMNNIRDDRGQIDGVLSNFVNMVLNDGDATTSSKEALVNLLKLKAEQADKMERVADLMTRLKLKERDTFPRYLAASQQNTINITSRKTKRAILDALDKAKKLEKKDDTD